MVAEQMMITGFSEVQIRSLERWIDEWLKECGVAAEDISGLQVDGIDDAFYLGGSIPEEFPYKVFYSYETKENKLRKGKLYFKAHAVRTGLEDVEFST